MANLGGAQAAALGSMGASQAAGQIGAANALTGAFGQGANLYMQNQLMDRYFNRPANLSWMNYASPSQMNAIGTGPLQYD
jgi:hypothetical protein